MTRVFGVEFQSEFESTKDTPYLALMGKLWGVFCEDFRENWWPYNGTTLYLVIIVVSGIIIPAFLAVVRLIFTRDAEHIAYYVSQFESLCIEMEKRLHLLVKSSDSQARLLALLGDEHQGDGPVANVRNELEHLRDNIHNELLPETNKVSERFVGLHEVPSNL